ncbi:MAG: TadE/TadG family type IV pilus assembly protein [Hyphomonas sp.]|uniref:TadE/TadG family type IV pilus assembly protein n=1 Tax=Hyphomonas sp. TaxID=87 RepID=UPI003297815A
MNFGENRAMGTRTEQSLPAGQAMRLLKSQAGNIMPMAAIAMVALAGLVGGGVDVSRAYMVQNRLQNACDAGVLAGRKAVDVNGFDTAANTEANLYFDTNFDEANEGVTGTSFNATSPNSGDTVNGVASTTVDTAVMQLFGFKTIPLSVSCTATMAVGDSDVMMVLDVTGSMACTSAMTSSDCTSYINSSGTSETAHGGDSRIKELRAAMKSFYDTVDSAASGSNSRIRFGFVPYSSSVNVGQLIYDENPSWLVDSWAYQSREAQYVQTEHQTVTGYMPPREETDTGAGNYIYDGWYLYSSTGYRNDSDCLNGLPADTPWTDNGSTTTTTSTEINSRDQRVTTTTVVHPQERTNYACYYSRRYENWYRIVRYEDRDFYDNTYQIEDPVYTTETVSSFDHWDYKLVTYDTSSYKAFAATTIPLGSSGSNITTSWEGCIEERNSQPVAAFSWDSATGLDPADAYDIDIDTVPGTTDATKWRPMWPEVGYYRTTDSSNRYLSSQAVSDYGRKASSYCPKAARHLAVMSKTNFDAYADSLLPSGATYHNLGMVWGARLASPTGPFQSTVTSSASNGGSVARHIIFMTDGNMSPTFSSITSYGIEFHDQRVTTDGYSNDNERHTSRFLAACEQAKAKGMRVWVIAFATGLSSDLNSCASSDSAFAATNSSQLNTAFQEIAKDVGELRITQ